MSFINVNGVSYPVVSNLYLLLEEMSCNPREVVTALNGHFIAIEKRQETSLKPGDKIEILTPMQGG